MFAARPRLRCPSIFFVNCCRDPLRRGLAPIRGHRVPQHRRQAQLARNAKHRRPPRPKRRPEKLHRRARDLLQRFLCALQLFANAAPLAPRQIGMGPRMIPDQVPGRRDPPHQLRLASARLPSRKNVARTSWRARISSSRGVHVALGPSSKVSASSPGRVWRNQRLAEDPRSGPHGRIGVSAHSQTCAGNCAQSRINFGRNGRDHSAFQYAAVVPDRGQSGSPAAATLLDRLRRHLPRRLSAPLARSRLPPCAAWRAVRSSAAPAATSSST